MKPQSAAVFLDQLMSLAAGQQVRQKVGGGAVVGQQLQELGGTRLRGDNNERLCWAGGEKKVPEI